MPTSWMIKVGAVAATKRNLAQNIESGFSILVTKCPGVQARNVEEKSGKEALYLLFEGKSDADAASRLLLAEPATDSARAELATALAKAAGPESGPHTIRHFQQISAEWRALCEPEEEQQEPTPDEPDPLLGEAGRIKAGAAGAAAAGLLRPAGRLGLAHNGCEVRMLSTKLALLSRA